MKFIAALVIGAAGFAVGVPAEPAFARGGAHKSHECKASLRATGSANLLKRLARQSAVKAWGKDAETVAGAEYAKWEKARRKSVNCKASGRVMVRCVARGAPCK